MAKKELSREEREKKEARLLINDFNQIVKNLTSLVFLGDDGTFMMKSEDTKIERYGEYYDKEKLPISFTNIIYNTLDLAEFRKDYRFSTSTVEISDTSITIGQTANAKVPSSSIQLEHFDMSDAERRIQTLNSIQSMFYKKIPTVLNDGIDESKFLTLSDSQLDDLEAGYMIELIGIHPNTKAATLIYITKAVFPMVSKVTKMEYQVLSYENPLDAKYAYVLFRETIEDIGIHIYSLTAAYQSI